MRFGFNVGKETERKLLTLWNSYTFFKTYVTGKREKSTNLLDKWIVSKLHNLIKNVTNAMDNFDAMRATVSIENFFINDLSLWYIRRSRKRMDQAEGTLYFVLLELSKLIAPFLPFLAEELYGSIKQDDMPESVHLCDFPVYDKDKIDDSLENEMKEVREIVNLGLSLRTEKGFKVRQPLQELKINKDFPSDLKDLIKEEVNVKKVSFVKNLKEVIDLDTVLTEELKKEGLLREIIRHIQDLRKKAGLTPKDEAIVFYAGDSFSNIFKDNRKEILSITRSLDIKKSKGENFLSQKEVKIEDDNLFLAIKK